MEKIFHDLIFESQGRCIKSTLNESIYSNTKNNDIIFDLTNISNKEIVNQYTNFKFAGNPFIGFGSLLMENSNGEYVAKNKNITVDIETVKKDISFIFGLKPWQFKIEKQCNDVACAFLIPNIDDNAKLLIKSMKQLGWFNSICSRYYIDNKEYVNMKFEPLYELDITKEIHNNIKVIYHVSPAVNFNQIKKKGFIPLSNNNIFDYPNRVYFIKGIVDEDTLINVAYELYKYIENQNLVKYNIYTLDVSKIPLYITFQNDPNMDKGIFTYYKVPYKAVSNVRCIDLREEIFI